MAHEESHTEFEHVRLDRDERGVVTVTLDVAGKPVNVIDDRVLDELDRVVARMETDDEARAVVFRSGKESGFLAGADVKKIASIESAEQARSIVARGQELFGRIENLSAPTLAVIHGPCLGGGLELALACTRRIARDDASTRLGLPETTLGLLPAWGGTQRLPRAVGLLTSLEMMLNGKRLTAGAALRLGLVDRTAPPEEFDETVEAVVGQLLKDPAVVGAPVRRPWWKRLAEGTGLGRRLIFRGTARQIARQKQHYPALGEVVEAVRRGTLGSLDDGLAYEREAFARLLFTPTCRSLLGLFFGREQARNVSTWVEPSDEGRRPIETVAVIGAGAMGAGIAQLVAYQGLKVVVKEIDQSALDAGMRRIEKLFEKAVRAGRLRTEEAEQRRAQITPTLHWEPVADADLAVEAVVEREDVKQRVFADLEEQTRPDCLLASNTSSLSVEKLGSGLAQPERMGGLHFFNPVHRMELVEVVRTAATSEANVERLVRLVRRLGKTPIVTADSPGFLVNRVLFPYLGEAVRLEGEGVDARLVDGTMRRFGMPMGPLELLDQVGIDIAAHVADSMQSVLPEGEKVAERLNALVEQGALGAKSGRGFYEYKGGRRARPRETPGRESRSAEQPEAREIERRLVLPMVNEAARCLQDAVVAEAWMVDLAMVLGTGFAPFRGGPLRMADTRGIGEIVAELREFEKRFGPRFTPCRLLVEMAGNESSFHEAGRYPRRPLTV